MYGQTLYPSKDAAIAGINDYIKSFTRNPVLVAAKLAGVFVVQEGATDLQDDTEAVYLTPANDESFI